MTTIPTPGTLVTFSADLSPVFKQPSFTSFIHGCIQRHLVPSFRYHGRPKLHCLAHGLEKGTAAGQLGDDCCVSTVINPTRCINIGLGYSEILYLKLGGCTIVINAFISAV